VDVKPAEPEEGGEIEAEVDGGKLKREKEQWMSKKERKKPGLIRDWPGWIDGVHATVMDGKLLGSLSRFDLSMPGAHLS
jgi:hypothetical protein